VAVLVLCLLGAAPASAIDAQVSAGPQLVMPAHLDEAHSGSEPFSGVLALHASNRIEEPIGWRYNSDYMFGLSRGVANSTWRTGIKPFFFLVTIPLDIVLFPFALVGGLFG
jgi:hypothetical protein